MSELVKDNVVETVEEDNVVDPESIRTSYDGCWNLDNFNKVLDESSKNVFDNSVNTIAHFFGHQYANITKNAYCKDSFTIDDVQITSYHLFKVISSLNDNYAYLNNDQKQEFNRIVELFHNSYTLWSKCYYKTFDMRIKDSFEAEFNTIVDKFVTKIVRLSNECDANMLAELMTISAEL